VRHLGDRLDALVDDLLAPRQRDRLVAHAAHCGRCGEELALHRRVKERLERAAAPELPGDLADRLRSIAEENSPTVRPGLSTSTVSARLSGSARSARRRPTRWLTGRARPHPGPVTSVGHAGAAVLFEAHDSHRLVTRFSLLGLSAAGALGVFGVPRVDLHGPLHHVGIMDPLCGGTRAAFLLSRGEWGAAWTYNPVVFPLAVAAALLLLRTVVGALSGRWVSVRVSRRRLLVVLLVLALAALELRQQLHADLLTAAWPT
jgi:anti-sigma factor RsiW